MTTVCRVCSDSVIPPLLEYAASLLKNPELSQITKDDYGIFLTPEGELYDNSIIER